MKIPKFYYAGLIISLILLCFLEYHKRQEINWDTTFSSRDKIPYGCQVVYDMANGGQWNEQLTRSNETFYTLAEKDTNAHYNLIYLAQNIDFDKLSQEQLLRHISKGNQVLIVGSHISETLTEELGLEINYSTIGSDENTFQLIGKTSFTDTIKENNLLTGYRHITWNDSIDNVRPLGNQNKDTNFLAITHGKGELYLHTNPLPFSNYYLLKDASFDYVNEVFSLFSDAPLVWDDYMNYGSREASSEFRYILKSDAIRLAYYVLIALLLLYLGLGWRREQKAIPVITAPRNNSVDFIGNLTNLYLSSKNHGVIASYRIRAFKRNTTKYYGIQWNKSPELVKEQLLRKNGTSAELAESLITIIYKTDIKNIDQSTLIEINRTLDEYTS